MKTSKIYMAPGRIVSHLNELPNPALKPPQVSPAVIGVGQADVNIVVQVPPYPGMAAGDRVSVMASGGVGDPYVVQLADVARPLQFMLTPAALAAGALVAGQEIPISYMVSSPAITGSSVAASASVRVAANVTTGLKVKLVDIGPAGPWGALDTRVNYMAPELPEDITAEDRIYIQLAVNNGAWIVQESTQTPVLSPAPDDLRYLIPTAYIGAHAGAIDDIAVSFSLNTGADDKRPPAFSDVLAIKGPLPAAAPAPRIDNDALLRQCWKLMGRDGSLPLPADMAKQERYYAVIPPYAGMSGQDVLEISLDFAGGKEVAPFRKMTFPVNDGQVAEEIVAPLYSVADTMDALKKYRDANAGLTAPVMVAYYTVQNGDKVICASDRSFVLFG